MSPEQLGRMRAGRLAARRRRYQEAVHMVREFTRWTANGCPRREMPPVPRDSHYRLVRGGMA